MQPVPTTHAEKPLKQPSALDIFSVCNHMMLFLNNRKNIACPQLQISFDCGFMEQKKKIELQLVLVASKCLLNHLLENFSYYLTKCNFTLLQISSNLLFKKQSVYKSLCCCKRNILHDIHRCT